MAINATTQDPMTIPAIAPLLSLLLSWESMDLPVPLAESDVCAGAGEVVGAGVDVGAELDDEGALVELGAADDDLLAEYPPG